MELISVLCRAFMLDYLCNFPLVDIPSLGIVRGSYMSSAAGRTFNAFRGIPYAQPPVGNLRFRDPEPIIRRFGRIFDASQEGPICMQYFHLLGVVIGQEDCLNLNIYTHGVTDQLQPVMVFIHGGAWFSGSGSGVKNLFGPHYFLDRDIVLVTINYRLGPLGFLSTEDAEAPGNYGLLDQTMALRWVRDNIHLFGGDPEKVTIFGQSAGGASVIYHVLSPHSKDLFHRAITQSGSALNIWARGEYVGIYSKRLAESVGCQSSVSSEQITCLQRRPARRIVAFLRNTSFLRGIPVLFAPRIDVERVFPFIPAHPQTLLEQNRINSVPIIIGVNKNEAVYLIIELLANNRSLMKKCRRDPIKCMRLLTNTAEFVSNGEEIAQRAIDRYFFGKNPFEDSQLTLLEEFISDFNFNEGIDKTTRLLSTFSQQPVYYYYYTHRGRNSYSNLAIGTPGGVDLGVGHGDEIFSMFSNVYFIPRLSNPGDLRVSQIILDLWTSFAKDGCPASHLVSDGWISTQKNQTRYLKIDKNTLMINEPMPFYGRLVSFWNELLESYIYSPF